MINDNPYQVVEVGCLGNQMVDLALHTERLHLEDFLLLQGDGPTQPVLHGPKVNSAPLLVSASPGPVHQRVVHKGPQDGHDQLLLSPHHTQGNLTGQAKGTFHTNRTKGVDLLIKSEKNID